MRSPHAVIAPIPTIIMTKRRRTISFSASLFLTAARRCRLRSRIISLGLFYTLGETLLNIHHPRPNNLHQMQRQVLSRFIG